MILEAIVTSRNADGSINIAPMGPTIGDDWNHFQLRPFCDSTTFVNLNRTRSGVLHVTDDVELFARTAIGKLSQYPPMVAAEKVDGQVIADACRWYEFEVTSIDSSGPRAVLDCHTLHAGRHRDFWGFNRAKHAVLEAAILATRLHLLSADEVAQQLEPWKTIVNKTGGESEHRAMNILLEFMQAFHARPSTDMTLASPHQQDERHAP